MNMAQLSLIAELDLVPLRGFTPSRLARKFTPPESLSYALALLALLSGPLPLAQLQMLAGVDDGNALVGALRQLGLEMPCHSVPEMDTDGKVRCRAVCVLTKADVRRVNRWLKKRGSDHV
jgi:hypothetical protein